MPKFIYEKTKDFTIMSNHHLRDKRLSFKAVGLLSFMLSVPDTWDWTVAGLVKIRKDGKEAVSSAMKELERFGYLERCEVRDTQGRFADIEYNIYEIPKIVETVDKSAEPVEKPAGFSDEPEAGKPISGKPKAEKPPPVSPAPENPQQRNINQPKTNGRKTNIKNTDVNKNQSIKSSGDSPAADGTDDIKLIQVEEKLRENINYDRLCRQYGRTRTNEIIELMLGIMYSAKKTVHIAGSSYPADYVKSRIMMVNYKNVEYVFDNMDKTTTKIANIHAYLKTALFNSLSTTDSHYRAETKRDMEEFWANAVKYEAAKKEKQHDEG